MRINEAQLKSIIDELTLDKEQLKEVASALRFDMELALQGRESSMPMLCSLILVCLLVRRRVSSWLWILVALICGLSWLALRVIASMKL